MRLNFFHIVLLLFIFSNSILAQLDNPIEKEKEIAKDLSELELTKNHSKKVDLYFRICKSYQKFDIYKSNEYAEKLLLVSKENNREKGISYYNLIKSYNFIYNGQYKEAVKSSKNASLLLKSKNFTNLYLEAIYYQVVANYFLGYYVLSNQIAVKAIHETKGTRAYKQIGLLYNLIGANNSNLNNLYLSLTNLESAAYYFNIAKDKNGLMNCYNQIADIYLKTNQGLLALNYSDKALQIAKEINNIDLQSYAILLLFNTKINLAVENISNASKNLSVVNDLLHTIDNKGLRVSYFLLKANLFYLKNKYREALFYCNKAQELKVDYEFSTVKIKYLKAKCYQELKLYLEAKKIYEEIQELFKSQKFLYIGIDNSDFYSDFARNEKMLGNYENAYNFSQEHSKWQKIKTNKENKDQMLFLLTKYDLNQKNIEIKNNIIEKQKIASELQNNKNKMYFIVSILFFITLLFLFFFFRFKKEKKYNNILSDKNKTIQEKNFVINKSNAKLEQLLVTKEILLKEIHHRVKNNLQLVMSLLRSQARNGGDDDINIFIEKSQSRIESIALIHQNLYQSEYVEKVDMQEYITSLCETIIQSSSKDSTKIVTKVNAHDVYLDISIAIPIGLIINEIITNAIKYAYPNVPYGLINVDLKAISVGEYQLVLADFGVGIHNKLREKKSFGMELVSLLVEQIGGNLSLIDKEGLQYNINFDSSNNE